ncbi:GNAT family N-acetyltransferase [Deinococcus sp. VB142]|uniref:GNAT family N-acetyltransferase n=1 Tax=Deinococcus sp. VB142 TaxID=3112952 RepID=A0AAU6Q0Z0_9DEIO
MLIRPATPAGAASIAFHRYPAEADAPERPVYAEWVRGKVQAGEYLGLLALHGEAVVAGAGLVLLDWGPTRGNPEPLRARLVNVWTHENHRRQGLARRLVTDLLAQAKARGIGTLSLGSTEMARPLYGSLGFKPYPHEMLLKLEER